MQNLAVVVPSIRPKSLKEFLKAWDFSDCELIIIRDGERVTLEHNKKIYSVKDVMGKDSNLIQNFTSGCRNLGFAYIARFLPDVEYIFTFDDDVRPDGDTIGDHIKALESRVPVSWISTATKYMRGFPYAVRDEAEVVLSHGIWKGIADWDAPTQLVNGNLPVEFYKGAIPKGIYYPMCIMNVAFKRKILPYMFMAPKTDKIMRMDDIWCGITSKRVIDKKGWAVVTGLSSVVHERESNVFNNLVREAHGIGLNETYWDGDEKHPYFKMYKKQRKQWEDYCVSYNINS